jgi:hypothetical protein
MNNVFDILVSPAITEICGHCGYHEYIYERCIFANGKTHIAKICRRCNQYFNPKRVFVGLPYGVEIDNLPIRFDNRTTNVACEVCGCVGAELHHWAPKVVFGDEAEDWPKSYLCPEHHEYWARKIVDYFQRILNKKGV